MNNNKIDSATVTIIAILSIFLLFFLIIPLSYINNIILLRIWLIFLIFFIIVAIGGFIGTLMEKKQEEKKHIENIHLFQQEYDNFINNLGIIKSKTATLIETDNEFDIEENIPQYIWIANNHLNIFPTAQYYINYEISAVHKTDVSDLHLITIPIESILFFGETGELYQYTTISGGEISFKGALLGYIAAEDIGAIICSRKPIKTDVIKKDERRIELIYKNQDNKLEYLEFLYDSYKIFKKLIPSKELRKIIELNNYKILNETIK